MSLLVWVALSLQFISSASVSAESVCNSKHTKLLLMVDVQHNINLTITRLKNIFSYFTTKVEGGVIETLDVCLVDPIQEKTFLNLSHVNTSGEIKSAIDQHIQLNVSSQVIDKIKIQSAFDYTFRIIRAEIDGKTESMETIIIFIFSCPGSCVEFENLNRTLLRQSKDLNLIILLDVPSKIDPKVYVKNYVTTTHVNEILPGVFIESSDDFSEYNPVFIDLCDDCPFGWTRNNRSVHVVSCYRIRLLDHAISWLQSSSICESVKSSLQVFETKDELMFVEDHLNTNLNTSTRVVNVALFKRPGIVKSHYVWSNLRPFTLGENFDSNEDGNERCIAVSFSITAKNHIHEIEWKHVKCEEPLSRILMCEMEGRIFKSFLDLKNTQDQPVNKIYAEKLNKFWEVYDSRNSLYLKDENECKPLSEDKTFLCLNPNGVGKYPTRPSVPIELRCNTIQDCPDNSDEQGCDGCLGKRCDDGTCVPGYWLSRDGEQCDINNSTNEPMFLNLSDSYEIDFCNSIYGLEPNSNTKHSEKNIAGAAEWSPKCLYLRGSDGIPTGCHNKKHLSECRSFQCPEGFLKCPHSYCLPFYNVNDGVMDCPENIIFLSKSNCLTHLVNICDDVQQCAFGEDENYCTVTCPPGFKCIGQAVVVEKHALVPELESFNIFDIKTKLLNISGINLSNLKEKLFFPKLLELHASNCNIFDPGTIFYGEYMNQILYYLNLSHNNLVELFDYGILAILNNLEYLSLSHNEQLREIGYYSILSPKLHTLDVSFTKISSLSLHVLNNKTSMRSLNVFKTNIIKLGSLIQIRRFENLKLQNTLLSAANTIEILQNVRISSALYVDSYKYCCPQISTGGTPKHACHAPPEAFSSCEDLLSDVLKRSLLWLVGGVTVTGNIMVVTYRLFFDRGIFRKGYGIFVTNLSVSDFIMGVYLLIIGSTDVHYRDEYVLHEIDWRHSYLCQAAGFLSTLSCETSSFFVLLITLDRCLVLRFPFGEHKFSKLALVLTVMSTWIIGFILALVPVIHQEWKVYSSNGMCLGLPLTFGPQFGWHYSFAIFICVNFIVFISIAYGQMYIIRLIQSGPKFQLPSAQNMARRVQDINVAKQLFLVALSNFLCWFPICVLGLMTLAGNPVSPETYAWLVVFVMPLNAAVNPMIYTLPVIYGKWQDFKKGNMEHRNR